MGNPSPFRRIGAVLLLASGVLLAPVDAEVQKGLFLLLLVAGLWMTEALHLTATALLVPVLAVALGLLDTKQALAAFADPIIALFFGGFVLASALRRHGLDRMLAARLVALARGRMLPAALLLFLATAFISMWVSNTATAAMMLPLALGLVAGVDRERDRSTVLFVLLGVGWMASLGGMGSLVGSPPNALAGAAAGWSFADWFAIGLPALALLAPLAIVTLYLVLRPRIAALQVDAATIADTQGHAWSAGALLTLAIFALTVTLWMFSAPVGEAVGIRKDFDAVIAVGAAVLLLATGTLTWKDAERDVDWGVLLLFGGGLCLGAVLKASGTSDWLAAGVVGEVADMNRIVVLLALATFIVLLSELASNTAATALLLPLLLPMAPALGMETGELAAFVALTASCGFMLPVATPPNAIVFGSGLVPQRDMIRTGFWLDLVCVVTLVLMFA
jgi:sodium-dependent dicarboxylate transporter 2/3/5